jgi:hypothetical protein
VRANDGTGVFTISERLIRRRLQQLPRFVISKGGEYFFLPGIRALNWLAEPCDLFVLSCRGAVAPPFNPVVQRLQYGGVDGSVGELAADLDWPPAPARAHRHRPISLPDRRGRRLPTCAPRPVHRCDGPRRRPAAGHLHPVRRPMLRRSRTTVLAVVLGFAVAASAILHQPTWATSPGVPPGSSTTAMSDVSLRLLYLIFDRLLSWLTLVAAQRRPKTSSSSSCATRSWYCAEPTRGLVWTGPTEPCSPR